MKIYFDVSTLEPNRATGVGTYMLQLIRHIHEHNDIQLIPVLKLSRFKKKKSLESFLNMQVRYLHPYLGLREKKALYHGPDFKLQLRSNLPRIVTIHDMVVFQKKFNNPKFYKKGIEALKRVFRSKPDAIIVNSEFTRAEVIKYFPELQDRIKVTLLGCDRQSTETLSSEFNNYILYLGTLETRKNLLGVIQSFEILCKKGRTENLVLAGKLGFGSEEIKRAIEASQFKDRIFHLDYVPNKYIGGLFKNAKVFIFPSWYEGFGIPILEAMSLGCPVVTSNIGVMPEIAGGAALLTDPQNPHEIANALEKVLTDTELRTDLIKKGYRRACEFTWKNCTNNTVKIYKEVLRNAENSSS